MVVPMAEIRQAAVAGTFYPADPAVLQKTVDELLADAGAPQRKTAPKALIAPHAGYVYSGPVAASVYRELSGHAAGITRVVLLGPSHRVAFKGIAASSAAFYQTPLGKIPIDHEAVQKVLSTPNVGFLDQAHAQEHSLEVHLPFLQRQLGEFTLVPLVVGEASPADVARVLDALWLGPETLVVISTDLSHFHAYSDAQHIDAQTVHKIRNLDATLKGEEACGCRPVNGLLTLARQRGYRVAEVDVRNSGDTAGDPSRVVGYGAFILETEPDPKENAVTELSLANQQRLIQVAREAILSPLCGEQNFNVNLNTMAPALKEERATFVTLNMDGRLRGCIGSLVASRPLAVDVAHNAQAAAFKDTRFKPLTLGEYSNIDVHISILNPAEPMNVASREELIAQLRPGTDGLIIEENGHRATYLPSVWSQLPTPDAFVTELRKKAGLAGDGWSSATRVSRYTTEEFA